MSRLTNDWYQIDEIIIYGFGSMAKTYIDNICKIVRVVFIIDNNPNIYGKSYKGIPVYRYEEAKERIENRKIVVMTESIVYGEIATILERDYFIENRDFTTLERFVCEWSYKHANKICLLEVHSAVTTKCTFNCRKCNMFIPYHKEKVMYSFEKLKKNIDLLFNHVDMIFKYQLVGGEPFLNKELGKYLNYIYRMYGDKIGCIRVITNGSIVPDDELIEALKACRCEVHISNYLHAIDYGKSYYKVIECLRENEINYTEMESLRWRDVGFPERPCNFRDEDVKSHMMACGTSWHGLIDERLYYCNSAWSAAKSGLFRDNFGDYIDLKNLSKDTAVELLDLCLGDLRGGYNSFCKVCGGCGEDNHNFILAGEQKV